MIIYPQEVVPTLKVEPRQFSMSMGSGGSRVELHLKPTTSARRVICTSLACIKPVLFSPSIVRSQIELNCFTCTVFHINRPIRQHLSIRFYSAQRDEKRDDQGDSHSDLMLVAPTTHFVEVGQAILYRGAGIDVVWKPFLWLAIIGAVLFALSLARFRKTISRMA